MLIAPLKTGKTHFLFIVLYPNSSIMAYEKEIGKPGLVYRTFKTYLRFLHDKIYYKKTYCINKEVLPSNGTPLLIVSNHQNCLNDPLGVLFAFTDRKANFITRADVFALSPIANKFLRSIGLLPAFRLSHEGADSLGKNEETFKMSEKALLDGNTVMMYPEAGHQDKRWLGDFSFGYTKLAFEAAEMGNFEKEIFILPSCNHYSDYFGIQNQFMVKFGSPISLKPYYELYKTKPRTAQREVNKLVREQISNLMLNINDLEHYDAIYFMCHEWGNEYAREQGIDPDNLPEKLLIEKEIVTRLDEAKQQDEHSTKELYHKAVELIGGINREGISYRNLVKAPSAATTFFRSLLLVLLFPLWIFSLWPGFFIYQIAIQIQRRKSRDRMFEGTFLYALSALFTIPLFCGATFILTWIYSGLWAALIYMAIMPLLMIFAWNYKKWIKTTLQDIRYLHNKQRIATLVNLKKEISDRLAKIVKKQASTKE